MFITQLSEISQNLNKHGVSLLKRKLKKQKKSTNNNAHYNIHYIKYYNMLYSVSQKLCFNRILAASQPTESATTTTHNTYIHKKKVKKTK